MVQLNNILYVPTITKNLINISQLTKNNNIIIEFTFDSYFVKDRVTHRILLHDTMCNSLYQLDLSAPLHQALQADHVSTSLWHSRLVQCSPLIILISSKQNKIIVSSSKLNLYTSCCQVKAHKLPFISSSIVAIAPL
jgi:hypothetical protein